jgi:hypothetical protein
MRGGAVVLTLKLLSAAEHTYAIKGDGPVDHWGDGVLAPASGNVGWLPNWPVGYAAGPGDHNAGLVGRVREGVIVALRGTRIPELTLGMTVLDWLGDWLIDLDIPLAHDAPFAGQVHPGFRAGVATVWPELVADIRRAVTEADAARAAAGLGPSPIFVTGHSKGGGMAPLVAWGLRDEYPAPRDIVVRTFAAPNMADRDFAAAYGPRVTQHVRYECAGDAIPHLPFSDAFFGDLPPVVVAALAAIRRGNTGYRPLDALSYIQPSGVIVSDSPALRLTRRDAFCTALLTPAALNAKDRHLLRAGGGYCSADYQPCAWTIAG